MLGQPFRGEVGPSREVDPFRTATLSASASDSPPLGVFPLLPFLARDRNRIRRLPPAASHWHGTKVIVKIYSLLMAHVYQLWGLYAKHWHAHVSHAVHDARVRRLVLLRTPDADIRVEYAQLRHS